MQFLQAAKSASPLHAPVLQQDVSLYAVILLAALNPAAAIVAYLMGRHSDNNTKLAISAFAGAIAGIAALWLAARLHVPFAVSNARAASGIFVLSFICCFFWAWIGRRSVAPARP
ncbi:MAG: hypothetical protein ABL898_00745 [Hyphomicrobiaceae bacterium]|nr:hypothetical protein [Hyphomicrobiaceae bacterium]